MDERVTIVADNLRVDAVTIRVMRALDEAGVTGVLLKGPAIGRWLYSQEDPRPYRDCDVLVEPAQMDAAREVLAQAGFNQHFDREGLPDWWSEHAEEWWHADDRVYVDLHHGVAGVGVDDETAWHVLTRETEEVLVAGHPVHALALPARTLHVVLHAAHHGAAVRRPMADLERALAQVEEAVWHSAAALAEELEATSSLAAGLHLTPAGRELSARLELPSEVSAGDVLRASSPPPVALGFEQLARAGGMRARVAIVWRKLVPPPGFMRRWHPIASRGRLGLLAAYLLRPVWILRAAPRGFRAWWEARREASTR